MAFRFNAIDPSTGYEQWFDPTTGAYQLRPPANDPAPTTITTTQSQSTSQQTPTSAIPYTAPTTSVVGDVTIKLPDSQATTTATAPSNTQAPAAAPGDDASINNTISGTAAIINASTDPSNPISPRGNILDQYASYTYNLGWYLLTPTQLADMSNSPNIDVNKWSLLVQSGGAASQQAGISQLGGTGNQNAEAFTTSGRNKYFTLDYYLDDLEIVTALGTPAQVGELSFKVTEPNGITLLPNLTSAVKDLYRDIEAAPNLANYCLVIKFYGWDVNGNLITSPDKNVGIAGATPNNTNAVATKYYPFQIAEFNFKAAGKAIEYHIKGVASHYQYGSSSGTASIPYNLQLTGETLGAVLGGTILNGTNNSSGSGREATTSTAPTTKGSPTTITNQEKALAQLGTIKNFIYNPFGSSNSQANNGWGEG